MTTPTGDLGG